MYTSTSTYDYSINHVCNNKPTGNEKYDLKIEPISGKINYGIREVFVNKDSKYKIRLDNNTEGYCQAILCVDGRMIGKWLMCKYTSLHVVQNACSDTECVGNRKVDAKFYPHLTYQCENELDDCEFVPDYLNGVVKRLGLVVGNVDWDDI